MGPWNDTGIIILSENGNSDKQHNIDPTFDNVHNNSVNDCTDIKQTIDNSDIGDPNESKTETIDDNARPNK